MELAKWWTASSGKTVGIEETAANNGTSSSWRKFLKGSRKKMFNSLTLPANKKYQWSASKRKTQFMCENCMHSMAYTYRLWENVKSFKFQIFLTHMACSIMDFVFYTTRSRKQLKSVAFFFIFHNFSLLCLNLQKHLKASVLAGDAFFLWKYCF